MIRPFRDGMLAQACPMSDILDDLTGRLAELTALKQQAAEQGFDMAPS